jgi:hypothetical protein
MLLTCTPFQQYFRYDYDEVKAKAIKSVVIVPADMVRERPRGMSAGDLRRFEDAFAGYVESHGYVVVNNASLMEKWRTEEKGAHGFFDPVSGKIDSAKLNVCLQRTIAQTHAEQDFDGVILPQFVLRPARLMGDRVYWDGSDRKIFEYNGDVVVNVDWRGEIDALSLQVQVFNKAHDEVLRNTGAIEFPFVLKKAYGREEFVWKDSLQLINEEIMEGIGVALHPFIPFADYPQRPRFSED